MNTVEFDMASTYRWIYLTIEFISGIFQLSMLIFFFYMQIRRRGFYRYPYYVLLTLYMIADSPRFIGVVIDFWLPDSGFKADFLKWFHLYFWFDMVFASFCQLGIGTNRLTAVLYPMRHVFFWSRTTTAIICFGVILASSLSIFIVKVVFNADAGSLFALCVVLSLTTLTICIYTTTRTMCLKKNTYSIISSIPRIKMEKNLLQQALFTNLNCILYFLCVQLDKMDIELTLFSSREVESYFFKFLQLFFFTLEHFGSLVFLLMMSQSVRNEYVAFYSFRSVREKCTHDNEVTAQPVKALWVPLAVSIPFRFS